MNAEEGLNAARPLATAPAPVAGVPWGIWVGAALLVALALLVVWWWRRRRSGGAPAADAAEPGEKRRFLRVV